MVTVGGHAEAQRLVVGKGGQEGDLHRDALHHLDPVAGGVLRRQQREGRTGAGHDGIHPALKLGARIGIHLDGGGLAEIDVGEFGFLVVGLDPKLLGCQGHQHHQGLARLHPVAHLHLAPGDVAGDFGGNLGVLQIEAGLLQFRPGLLDSRLLLRGREVEPPMAARACWVLVCTGPPRPDPPGNGYWPGPGSAGERCGAQRGRCIGSYRCRPFKVGLRFGHLGLSSGDLDVLFGQVLAQAPQIALGLGHGGLIVLGLQGDQDLAGLDELVVIHSHLGHPARHPGRDHPHVAVNIGVVGADEGMDMVPIPTPPSDEGEQHHYQA